MNRDELEGKGLFQERKVISNNDALPPCDRIQQLQRQIEVWEALLEKLGGIEGESAIASVHLAKRVKKIAY